MDDPLFDELVVVGVFGDGAGVGVVVLHLSAASISQVQDRRSKALRAGYYISVY